MSAVAGSDGSYAFTLRPSVTADYRLGYDASPSEGVKDATSAVLRIAVGVGRCTMATKPSTRGVGLMLPPCL